MSARDDGDAVFYIPLMLLIAIIVVVFAAGSYLNTKEQTKLGIACYEAAKINTNIKCDTKCTIK